MKGNMGINQACRFSPTPKTITAFEGDERVQTFLMPLSTIPQSEKKYYKPFVSYVIVQSFSKYSEKNHN